MGAVVAVYMSEEILKSLSFIKKTIGDENTSRAVQAAVKLTALSLASGTIAVTNLPIKQEQQS